MKDKETRQSLVQKYLNAETSSQEEKMLAEYYATHRAAADEREIAALILSGVAGFERLLDTGNEEFENIIAAETAIARRRRFVRGYSYLAIATCAIALVYILYFGYHPTSIDKNSAETVAASSLPQTTDVQQEPEVEAPAEAAVEPSRHSLAPALKKPQLDPALIAENSRPQNLCIEDVFPSSWNSPDPELMFEIEEELQHRMIVDGLEKEIEARMAMIKEEKETVNL